MSTVQIIADSKHYDKDTRITTFELTFPRWILAEFNTHRQLSRNSASSRAIPIQANIDNIINNTAMPVHWGINQAGMVANNEADEHTVRLAIAAWIRARDNAIKSALELNELGIHKQITNRLIENFTYQKVIVTATEWDNFFWLRYHKDAQPEIKDLADLMLDAYNKSTPQVLNVGEWHVPYVSTYRDGNNHQLYYYDSNDNEISLDEARKISASCCAQVSYRKSDDSLEKALRVFDMLNLDDDSGDTRKHSSPIEHQATPVDYNADTMFAWYNMHGVTAVDENADLWSGNFKNWVQYRHLFDNDSCTNHPDIEKK
jgi:thymidylate synthase ThyX